MWAFYWFLGQLVFPMIAIGWVTNIFQRGAASMGRLNFILTRQAEHLRRRDDGRGFFEWKRPREIDRFSVEDARLRRQFAATSNSST